MTHRTHSSFRGARRPKASPPPPLEQQRQGQQRLAEGMRRPMPGLTPPMTHDQWVAAQAAEIGEGS